MIYPTPKKEALPGADMYCLRILSFPQYPTVKLADVERVVGALAGELGVAA